METFQEDKQNTEFFRHRIELGPLLEISEKLRQEIKKVIVGQDHVVDMLIVALLAQGHVILEGIPGVAKTLTAKLIAASADLNFKRIQFTPDLMPSDILGTSVYSLKNNEFEFKKGPIFSQLILIDEINRAPAKTQAALFEVMEEMQITLDGETYPMQKPFMIVATQNPIEHEGTYRLPEAQLDRFMMKITMDHPQLEEEIAIITREHALADQQKTTKVSKVLTTQDIVSFQKIIKEIHIEPNVLKYIAEMVVATRNHPFIYLGASPRATIALLNASKSLAAIQGKDFVTPECVQYCAKYVLGHRIVVAPEKEMEGITSNFIVDQIISTIEIPR